MKSLLIFGFILILNAKVECNIEEIDTVKLGAEMIDANLREKEDNVVVSPINAVAVVSSVQSHLLKENQTEEFIKSVLTGIETLWPNQFGKMVGNINNKRRHFNDESALNNLLLSLSNTTVDVDLLAKKAGNKILINIEEVDAWISEAESSYENTKFVKLSGIKRVKSIHSEQLESQVFRISAADRPISFYIIVPYAHCHAGIGILELNRKLSSEVIKDIQDEMDKKSKGLGQLTIPKIDFTSTVDLLQINEDVGLFNGTEIETKMNEMTQTVTLKSRYISGKGNDGKCLDIRGHKHALVLDSPFTFLLINDETHTSFLQGVVMKF